MVKEIRLVHVYMEKQFLKNSGDKRMQEYNPKEVSWSPILA